MKDELAARTKRVEGGKSTYPVVKQGPERKEIEEAREKEKVRYQLLADPSPPNRL